MKNLLKGLVKILKKESAILLLVILTFFLVRLYFVFTVQRPVEYDQFTYDAMAMSLLTNHEYSMEKGTPTAYVTPLYAIFLSGVYLAFGHSYLWVKIIQAALGSLTCWVIYLIAREVFDKAVGRIALFLTGIHYFFISYGLLLNSENLFIFFVALSILFLIKFCRSPSFLYAGLFGFFSSLAMLTRAVYFFFPLMAVAVLILKPPIINIAYKKILKFSMIILICLVLPMIPWVIRNYLVFRSFVPFGTETGIVLYAAYNPPKGKILDSSVHNDITLESSKMPELESSRFLTKHALLSIKNDLTKLYKYIPLRLMYFFSIFDWVAFVNARGAYNFSTAFILPLSLLGVFVSFKKRLSPLKIMILLPVIYFLLITVAIMGVPRTRLPVEPYLIIFAAFFISYAYKRSRHRAAVVLLFTVLYLLNYAFYIYSDNMKIIARGLFRAAGLW